MLFRQDKYLKTPPQSERTTVARSIDFGITLLLVWFVTILFFQVLIPVSGPAAVALVIILAMEAVLTIKYKIYQRKRINRHRDIWFSARKCREQLLGLTSQAEFTELIKTLLASSGVFKDLHMTPPPEATGIDIVGLIRGKKVGIMCVHSEKEDYLLPEKPVKKFLQELKQAGFSKGIVITTGYFAPETKRFVQRNTGKTTIRLLDGDALIRMAQRAGHPIFPDEKWRDERDRVTGRELALLVKNNVLASRSKALTFIALGTIFLVVYTQITGFSSPIYLIFGIINLFVGFTSLVLYYLQQQDAVF